MTYDVKVLADSISPRDDRLTTFEATYPRIIHAKLQASFLLTVSPATTQPSSLWSLLHDLIADPFVPAWLDSHEAVEIWLAGRDRAMTTALELALGRKKTAKLFGYEPYRDYVACDVLRDGLDKLKKPLADTDMQPVWAGLEAYMWQTAVMTATEWEDFFAQHDQPAGQGEMAELTRLLRWHYNASQPRLLEPGQWHTPATDDSPSPIEHQATPFDEAEWTARRRMAMMAEVSGEEDEIDPFVIRRLQDNAQFCGNLHGWRSKNRLPETAA